jgi:DNA polymerase III subunit gamma/tau
VYAQKVYRGFESLSLRHLPFTSLHSNLSMSYLVLARKWRPQSFAEVVGQPHVTRTLQNAIGKDRVAHAYLFCGARGVGKTSVARILAKTLNCLTPVSATPCNACSNCREITQGNAVDVLEIDGASNRGIDSIRDLRDTVRYRPAKSRFKIYIIDEVHMLTAEAFNALLKTLEEPPEHVLFIFATTEPHKIPATILSRCQRFDFRRIPTQQLVEHLRIIISQEQVELPDDVLFSLAREADGSMRDAQSLLEQILAFSGEDLSGQEILDILGIVDRKSIHRAAAAILGGNGRICIEVVDDLYRRGIDSKRFCQQLCDHFRNLLVLATGGDGVECLLDLPEDEIRLLKNQLDKTSKDSLQLIFQMVMKAEEDIRRSSLPRITLEMLLLRLTQLPELESLNGILAKLSFLEDRLAGEKLLLPAERACDSVPDPPKKPISSTVGYEPADLAVEEPFPPPQIAPPAQGASVVSIDPGETVNQWPSFIRWLKIKDGILAAKLADSQVTLASERTLGLEVMEIFVDVVNESQSLSRLTEAARAFFGHDFQWVVRAKASPAPEAKGAHRSKRSKSNPRVSIMEHPVVLQALEILGGELVDIRTEKGDRLEAKRGVTPSAPEDGPELI